MGEIPQLVNATKDFTERKNLTNVTLISDQYQVCAVPVFELLKVFFPFLVPILQMTLKEGVLRQMTSSSSSF